MQTLMLSDIAAEISDMLDIDSTRAFELAEETTFAEEAENLFDYRAPRSRRASSRLEMLEI